MSVWPPSDRGWDRTATLRLLLEREDVRFFWVFFPPLPAFAVAFFAIG
jgi:hypothetical protein